MDFWVDLGVAAILRILKDRRSVKNYYAGLAKVHVRLDQLRMQAPAYDAEYEKAKAKLEV